jgi:hypothetical protein
MVPGLGACIFFCGLSVQMFSLAIPLPQDTLLLDPQLNFDIFMAKVESGLEVW